VSARAFPVPLVLEGSRKREELERSPRLRSSSSQTRYGDRPRTGSLPGSSVSIATPPAPIEGCPRPSCLVPLLVFCRTSIAKLRSPFSMESPPSWPLPPARQVNFFTFFSMILATIIRPKRAPIFKGISVFKSSFLHYLHGSPWFAPFAGPFPVVATERLLLVCPKYYVPHSEVFPPCAKISVFLFHSGERTTDQVSQVLSEQ